MNIKDLIEEFGYTLKKKSSSLGGEYSSPCPFCKAGEDRFLIWPDMLNRNGQYGGGRYNCRVCKKFGDAIKFLSEMQGLSYPEACNALKIVPQAKNNMAEPTKLKPVIVEEPSPIWKGRAEAFIQYSSEQLQGRKEDLGLLLERGFTMESINRFRLGFNPRTLFPDPPTWGLADEFKENGSLRKLWLPSGVTIPTFSGDQVIKAKVRRSEWTEGDQYPKYAEIRGSKQVPSVYGNSLLPCALVVESELDAMLVQQEAGDLVYSLALGGATKPLDQQTDMLLRSTQLLLFCPDFDKAGKASWDKWSKLFSNIHLAITPCEKSAGDYFKRGGNLSKWIEGVIHKIKQK